MSTKPKPTLSPTAIWRNLRQTVRRIIPALRGLGGDSYAEIDELVIDFSLDGDA